MNNVFLKNILRFVFLLLLQVFVLNNINLGGYINPYVYVLFILLLPVKINKSLLLILGFVTGLTIDLFGNTLGLHTASTVLIAFVRPGLINLFFGNIEFGNDEEPGLNKLGLGGFVRYTLVMVFIHHSALFFLEIFSFNHFLFTLYRILLSTLVTTLFITIIVLFFSKRKG